MKKMFLVMICLILSLSSCVSQSHLPTATQDISDEEMALQALLDFLDHLHAGEYADAVGLYGGSYAVLMDQNPDLDPDDHAALLRNACTINGMQCLSAGKVELEEKLAGERYVFRVELQNADGTSFEPGPCCGDERGGSSPSVFIFTVQKNDQGGFWVMDFPPYLP